MTRADRVGLVGAEIAPETAPEVALEVVHETRYAYAAGVSLSHHRIHLQPQADAGQSLDAFALEVEPVPGPLQHSLDVFGNVCSHFHLALPHQGLLVRSVSRVRVRPRFPGLDAAAAPAWEAVRDRLRYVARAAFEPACEFAQPSPYIPRLEVLREWARPSFPPGRPLAQGALDLMHRLHTEFAYRSCSTDVDTPLAQAFAQRAGVCQDFAHLMAGGLRMLGLPARYVSGYLLTQPAGDGPRLVGADASHAWVQVWSPDTPGVPPDGWLDLDPTNDLVPSTDHIRVAVGRDYGDVAPVRGVIRGGGEHTVAVAVTVTPLAPTPAR